MSDNKIEANLYELNKQLASQLPVFEESKERVQNFLEKSKAKYFMLLCREINYYTLFVIDENAPEEDSFADVVVECANDIGIIKAAEETDDGAFEIWVTDKDNNSFVMYLFDYDRGVVPCHK